MSHDQSTPGVEHGMPSADAIAQWRSQVTAFFNTEWAQVRQLMMELEQQSWSGAELLAEAATKAESPSAEPTREPVGPILEALEVQSTAGSDRLGTLADLLLSRMPTEPDREADDV